MKFPFNVVHVSGNVLFAARGGKIHSFSLEDGSHISTWKHPDVDKVDAAVKAISDGIFTEKPVTKAHTAEEEDGGGPPAKRQRTEEPKDETAPTKPEVQEDTQISEETKSEGKKKGGKKSKNRQNQQRAKDHNISRVPDRPVITHVTSTLDSSYILAITGHDKAIWVFENDGKGSLKQISKRTLPKRPSDVVIGQDSQIIVADKFGDVYSLPLLYDPTLQTASTPVPAKPAYKPSANTTTVHSKRNLRALQEQQRQMELSSRNKNDSNSKAEGPDFEITLLLGHVSMLTALVIGESEGRRYILTADRDEHIRVSRYFPQSYVIEGFCFGHTEFISSMVIPASRGDVLVSGGGDEDLFVWDWKSNKLLSKISILSLAQKILPEITKVAVSGLYSLVYPHDGSDLVYILAICQDISAIFSWQLTKNHALNRPAIIQLPGKPLSLSIKPAEGNEAPKIVAALDPSDPTQARSLAVYSLTMTDEKLATSTIASVDGDDIESTELDVDEKTVRSLLYNTEPLRKQATEREEERGEEQVPEDQMMEEAGPPEEQ
ncbi:tRNA (guanine-N(7)-)-methyltransferase subunit trm82 [Fusarium tjaetaba]|uniref:tRNA (Guanine-N(7)-)-methyltransferase subunit trm82 n=1 Tax=Fusarium tjaetaba TaxID=1567544 RepID=A0A8H5VW46_9HYPO|nr:tRNA (guanine-N(7)-)-methyltransferase subunit trm82 [Fusarium tjaetaba]KAF5639692.1 tRNA (guanine-N(7)-)-methyltransferase subunit trm82 [Fusarium tjaetaba]